jgi:hypothetical protein
MMTVGQLLDEVRTVEFTQCIDEKCGGYDKVREALEKGKPIDSLVQPR